MAGQANSPRGVAKRIQENKNAREKAVKFRQNKANLSSAPVGLYSETGQLGFMAPCKGIASELVVRAEKESTFSLVADGINISGVLPEGGVYEDSGSFTMARGDFVKAMVVNKDNVATEAWLSFTFKPLGKAASLVHFDPEANDMVTSEPGGEDGA